MVTAPDSHGHADASRTSAKIAMARRSGMRAAACSTAAAADRLGPPSHDLSESSSAAGAGGSFLRSIPSPGLMTALCGVGAEPEPYSQWQAQGKQEDSGYWL